MDIEHADTTTTVTLNESLLHDNLGSDRIELTLSVLGDPASPREEKKKGKRVSDGEYIYDAQDKQGQKRIRRNCWTSGIKGHLLSVVIDSDDISRGELLENVTDETTGSLLVVRLLVSEGRAATVLLGESTNSGTSTKVHTASERSCERWKRKKKKKKVR